jgi:transcriptional regulator GlxA family with amidase domain
MAGSEMIDVTVVLLEGGLPSTSLAPLEIFSCAGMLFPLLTGTAATPRFRVQTASVDGRKTQNFVPISLEPTLSLSEVKKTDLVIIPTAGLDLDHARMANARIIDWIAHRAKRTAVAGICTGVSLLAEAGLLDGRPATTHWAVVDACRARYPKVDWKVDRFVTEANNVFCGGGLYASIDLSLYLVEHFCGHLVAVQTAKALLLEMPRVNQSVYDARTPGAAHDDEAIQRAQKYLVSHFREQVDLDALATKIGMSPRTFARRFKAAVGDSALAYLHRLRIDRARHLLESAHRSVEEISRHVGYEDIAFFRQLFRRHTGVTPREYRARFGPRRVAPRASKTAKPR